MLRKLCYLERERHPKRSMMVQVLAFLSESVKDHYRCQYFEALDLAVESIKDRFDQPGYTIYSKLEDLLLKGAGGCDLDDLSEVSQMYPDIDFCELKIQLANLATYFNENEIAASLEECLKYLQSLSPAAKTFYSEVCALARLILVMPATNAISERLFSVMRRVKSYLRSTMGQARLNHVMILAIYKEQVDKLDLIAIANEFVSGNEHRLRFFGKFV